MQTDIKRVLAFSTCSQLGYMMLALGLADWTAGLFHLLTHAFFKALLFLCAGSVIVALHHEQDLLKMGGLRKKLPITAFTMLIGVAAIIGVPFFSGWYSKDMILGRVYLHADSTTFWPLAILAFGTVILTAYYMTRLWLLAFAGSPRDDDIHDNAHESPFVMTIPLIVLAVFSLGLAWSTTPWDAHTSYLVHLIHAGERRLPYSVIHEMKHDPDDHDHWIETKAEIYGFTCAVVGILIAAVRHRSGSLFISNHSFPRQLLQHRFYLDALYDWLFTKPTVEVSRAFGAFDKQQTPGGHDVTLDGAFTAAGTLVADAGTRLAPLQTGRLRGYITLLGLTVVGSLAILCILSRDR